MLAVVGVARRRWLEEGDHRSQASRKFREGGRAIDRSRWKVGSVRI